MVFPDSSTVERVLQLKDYPPGSQEENQMSNYFVYVLRNRQGKLYIGSTDDLDTRVRRHIEGKAGWTRLRGLWELTNVETFKSRSEARLRERYLKAGKANQELRQRLNSGKTSDKL